MELDIAIFASIHAHKGTWFTFMSNVQLNYK